MTPAQTELLDQAILRALHENSTLFGWPAGVIAHFAAADGFNNVALEEFVFRLEYLTGKKMVKEAGKAIHAANRCWKLAEAGLQYLDEHNLLSR